MLNFNRCGGDLVPRRINRQTCVFMWQKNVNLAGKNCEIEIRDESGYVPNSVANKFVYEKELFLDEAREVISSTHGVVVNFEGGETHSCVLLAGGGASGVHENSALVRDEKLIVAVSSYVCALRLPKLELEWRTETDWATCFGIYHSPEHECYISHGECDIARLSYSGEVEWQTSGGDIFTEGFFLREDFVEVADFNGECYRIDIQTGAFKSIED